MQFHDALVWAFSAMELDGDESCMERYARSGEQWRCAFAQYTLPEIATPTFVINSKFDSWSLLARCEFTLKMMDFILKMTDSPVVTKDGKLQREGY